MDTRLLVCPDRWLICSKDIETEIRGLWSQEEPRGSLMRLRLDGSVVETIAVADLQDRVQALTCRADCGVIRVVVERMNDTVQLALDSLGAITADVRLHIWAEAPSSVLHSLVTPEEPVLEEWARLRKMPENVATIGGALSDNENAYRDALRHWGEAASAELGDEFEEAFGAREVETTTSSAFELLSLVRETSGRIAACLRVRADLLANCTLTLAPDMNPTPVTIAVEGRVALGTLLQSAKTLGDQINEVHRDLDPYALEVKLIKYASEMPGGGGFGGGNIRLRLTSLAGERSQVIGARAEVRTIPGNSPNRLNEFVTKRKTITQDRDQTFPVKGHPELGFDILLTLDPSEP